MVCYKAYVQVLGLVVESYQDLRCYRLRDETAAVAAPYIYTKQKTCMDACFKTRGAMVYTYSSY